MMNTLLSIAAIPLVICTAIAVITYINITMIRKGYMALRRDPDPNPRPLLSSFTALEPFLAANHFEYNGHYGFGIIRLVNWQQASPDRINRTFSVTMDKEGRISHEFTSEFNDDMSLTTTEKAVAFTLPRPKGDFIQSCKCDSVLRLWQAHLDGERHIISRFHPNIQPSRQDFVEAVNRSTRRQAEYVASHFLYPIRASFWYFVTRSRMTGKTIREQFP